MQGTCTVNTSCSDGVSRLSSPAPTVTPMCVMTEETGQKRQHNSLPGHVRV